METILVTGGAGFIGNCFCKLLLKERPEWKVVNVDSLTYAANPNTIKEECLPLAMFGVMILGMGAIGYGAYKSKKSRKRGSFKNSR